PIVVYGGNSAVCADAQLLLEDAGFPVRVTRNVYPSIDQLDIVPARHVIHDAFEEHIIHAPGMSRIGEIVSGRILPTPGAVLLAAEKLAETIGDLIVVDVGGATTDVHSITDGSIEIAPLLTEPQPHSKRTVEGDLGTFVSASHVAEILPSAERPEHLPPAIPQTPEDLASAVSLARTATITGVQRHAGQLAHLYAPSGRQTVARGRDLTACRLLIGTGGALTRLPRGVEALQAARGSEGGDRLLPPGDATCVLDRAYIFACCGALLSAFDEAAVVDLMRQSIGLAEEYE
ncbi:MAG TPA: glutamate mutase L, partial [Coriobacteriia bacterium]|nr:glutamate mutase L [Coriobacteriia bacterium]